MTTVAVGSTPVSGIPAWPVYLGGLLGLGLYGYAQMKKGTTMTALEKTFRTLVTQLLQHIETLEREIDQSVRRSLYEEVAKTNEVLGKRVRELEDANASLARDNQERRGALSLTQERVRELEKRLEAKRKRR